MAETFPLASLVSGIEGNPVLELLASSDHEAVVAIAANQPFPGREVRFGGMNFTVDRGVTIAPAAGLSAKFGVRAAAPSMGLYADSAALLAALDLADSKKISLRFDTKPGERLLAFHWDYDVTGSISGKHPIGGVGSVSFGLKASHGSAFTVVSRVPDTEGARDAITRTLKSWKLPRLIDSAEDLVEGSVNIVEVEGKVAAKIAATLGFDFSFQREIEGGKLEGDLGLKIVAGLQAAVGFETAGRYIVAVERTGESTVRARIFRLSQRGWNFGMNLSARVQGNVGVLPGNPDDLIAAILGTHPLQILKDLDDWTDPSQPLSKHIAALIADIGIPKELLAEKLGAWRRLAGKVQATLWRVMDTLNKTQKNALVSALKGIATNDEAARAKFIASLIERAGFAQSPIGQILESASERGLLELLESQPGIVDVAQSLIVVLDGEVMQNFKARLEKALDLTGQLADPNPEKLTAFLRERIEKFLEKKLDSNETISEYRKTIHALLAKRNEIYAKVRQALDREYTFDVAATYERSTTNTALIDVTFDTSVEEARVALREVLHDADYTAAFENRAGVSSHSATLTHGIRRSTSIDVQMPFYKKSETSLTEALARVTAEEDGGRIVFYEMEASDTRTVRNRMMSQLWGSMRTGDSRAELGYKRLMVCENATLSDMRVLLEPFVNRMLPGKFGGEAPSFETWLGALDNEIEELAANGPNEFGDVLVAQEVALPGRALQAWFEPRTPEQVKELANSVSLRLQSSLKRALHDSYFARLANYENLTTARTLLTWASIPASTSLRLSGNKLTETREKPYWDWMDGALRAAMTQRSTTAAELAVKMESARTRLAAAGRTGTAKRYESSEISESVAAVRTAEGKQLLHSLLFSESQMVDAAVNALKRASEAAPGGGLKPAEVIAGLAEAGAGLMRAFHANLNRVFETAALRPMAGLLLVESAAVLDPSLAGVAPRAMLSLTVLKEQRAFVPGSYLAGKTPAAEDVALSERLVGG